MAVAVDDVVATQFDFVTYWSSLACALNCAYKLRIHRQYASDRQKLRGNQRADAAYAENYAERRVSARELAEEAPSPSRSSKL